MQYRRNGFGSLCACLKGEGTFAHFRFIVDNFSPDMSAARPGEIKFSFCLKRIKKRKSWRESAERRKNWLHRTATTTTRTLTSVSSETIFLHLPSLLLWLDFGAMGSTRVDFDVRRRVHKWREEQTRWMSYMLCRDFLERVREEVSSIQFFLQSKHELSKEWNVVEQAFSIIWALIEWLNNNTHIQQIVGSKSLSLGMGTTRFFFYILRRKKKLYSFFTLCRASVHSGAYLRNSIIVLVKIGKVLKTKKFVCSAASSARRVNELEQFYAVFEKLITITKKTRRVLSSHKCIQYKISKHIKCLKIMEISPRTMVDLCRLELIVHFHFMQSLPTIWLW